MDLSHLFNVVNQNWKFIYMHIFINILDLVTDIYFKNFHYLFLKQGLK